LYSIDDWKIQQIEIPKAVDEDKAIIHFTPIDRKPEKDYFKQT